MTLDDATDAFDHSPGDSVSADLLRTATEYHRDNMIATDTFEKIVLRVAEWLADV